MKFKLSFAVSACLGLVLVGCGLRSQPTATLAPTLDIAATVQAAAQATVAALPTAAPATVLAPVTVAVPVTEIVVVTATPEPAPATPTAAESPQAGATEPAATALVVALPPKNSTPVALNGGPNPIEGMTSMLFQESFDPAAFWETGDTAAAKIVIAGGKLTLTNKQTQTLVWSLNGIKGRGFYAQTYLKPGLCKYGDNYGLVMRAIDEQNLTLFGISCEGQYRLLNIVAGERTAVVDWTESPYILKMETTNLIGVRAVGDQFALYVNNYYLTTATVPAKENGRFGLYVGSMLSPNFAVEFTAPLAVRIGE